MKERIIITSEGLSLIDYLQDLYRYRHLLWSFSIRNLRAKYAQTFAGVVWALVNPLLSLLILGFVFGKVAKMDTFGIDPFLFTVVGLSAWTYVASVASWSANAIVNAQSMITKIYFPRMIIPMSTALVGLIDLAVVSIITIFLLIVHHYTPSATIVYFPLLVLAILSTGVVLGIWVSALCVRFRDFLHVVPFLLRIGLYASPVAYSVSSVDESLRFLYLLNPLTGLLEGARWCFFGGGFPATEILIFTGWLVLALVGGLLYFNHIEKQIADII